MLRYCAKPGCASLVPRGYCAVHAIADRRIRQRFYVGAAVNYGRRWRRLRDAYLRENPLCVLCLAADVVEPATDVDHRIPHRGDPALFWDRSNFQALCGTHHDQKTATESWGSRRKE